MASRSECFRCGAPRPAQFAPAGAAGGVMGETIQVNCAGYEGRIIGKGGSVIREIQVWPSKYCLPFFVETEVRSCKLSPRVQVFRAAAFNTS